MKIIYYAHHMNKYNTQEELKEIKMINSLFKDSALINPNGWIYDCGNEEIIMNQCLKLVENSDVIVFSTIENGIIGKGVYSEIKHALRCNKCVYLLQCNSVKLFNNKNFNELKIIYPETKSFRKYACIEC